MLLLLLDLRRADRSHLRVLSEEREPAGIAIIDIRMPGRDGLWLAEQIRERWPRTAIIMASGADDIRSIETSRRIGALVLGLRYRRTRRELAESLGTDFAMREPVQRRRRPHLHEKPRHSSEPIVVAWTFVCLVMDKRKIRALMTAA